VKEAGFGVPPIQKNEERNYSINSPGKIFFYADELFIIQ
jgi:hypothetical protein